MRSGCYESPLAHNDIRNRLTALTKYPLSGDISNVIRSDFNDTARYALFPKNARLYETKNGRWYLEYNSSIRFNPDRKYRLDFFPGNKTRITVKPDRQFPAILLVSLGAVIIFSSSRMEKIMYAAGSDPRVLILLLIFFLVGTFIPGLLIFFTGIPKRRANEVFLREVLEAKSLKKVKY